MYSQTSGKHRAIAKHRLRSRRVEYNHSIIIDRQRTEYLRHWTTYERITYYVTKINDGVYRNTLKGTGHVRVTIVMRKWCGW